MNHALASQNVALHGVVLDFVGAAHERRSSQCRGQRRSPAKKFNAVVHGFTCETGAYEVLDNTDEKTDLDRSRTWITAHPGQALQLAFECLPPDTSKPGTPPTL